MLKDTVRMQAYRDAIQMNAKDFRDKVTPGTNRTNLCAIVNE